MARQINDGMTEAADDQTNRQVKKEGKTEKTEKPTGGGNSAQHLQPVQLVLQLFKLLLVGGILTTGRLQVLTQVLGLHLPVDDLLPHLLRRRLQLLDLLLYLLWATNRWSGVKQSNVWHSDVRCYSVRCSGVRCSCVRCPGCKCSSVRCSSVRCSCARCSSVKCAAMKCTGARWSCVRWSGVNCSGVEV